ncbi:X-ray repair cross-complementing protein 5 [Venturia canescens]|uniref:X-ray repair cross-complementing protein 5 n=1 Tax=Venturia canescens TaxID=32260 RepID=UPI001C9C7E09|nr:X-ray repair cross-complementing protein 5 [Venturia canescens]
MEESQDNYEHFGYRDGTIFVIDASPEMFEKYPESNNTYFSECLTVYERILCEKLMWNRRDWMGLILYNVTKNWNLETEYILTVQKFSEIETNMAIELKNILEEKTTKEEYCDASLEAKRDICLHDVLWQASRCFDVIKIAMSLRQVVLLTRNDNPLANDLAERHKIRLRAKTYKDINVKLRIVGLKECWNHDLFYKDLDVLANNCDPEDSKFTKLNELEKGLLFAAKTSGHLTWKIGKDLEIPVRLASFSSKTTLKKARMHKDTNEILEVVRHWGPSRQFEDVFEDEDDQGIPRTQIPDYIRKGVRYGGRLITFKPKELQEIRSSLETGIKLIGFKRLPRDDFMGHIKPTKFVGVEASASDRQKVLFAAFLRNCRTRKVMAICSVSHRSMPYIAKMIACDELDGFYLRKIPFKEQINNLKKYTADYVYDNEKPLPVDEKGVSVMKQVIKKLSMEWDPTNFSNPKIKRKMDYIQTLALDREFTRPFDSTRPDKEAINDRLGDLVQQFENLFGKPVLKRAAISRGQTRNTVKEIKFDDDTIRTLVARETLQGISVANLRSIARSIGVQTTGLKIQLIERITAHYTRN